MSTLLTPTAARHDVFVHRAAPPSPPTCRAAAPPPAVVATDTVTMRELLTAGAGGVPHADAAVEAAELAPPPRRRQAAILAAAFVSICITIGFNQSYGVFQSYYTTPGQDVLAATADSALVAFVGTLGAGLTWAGSIVINPLMSRVADARVLPTLGVLAMSAGLGLASCATQIWHLLLTQGLLYGMGSSLLYFPILSVAPEYFNQHRGLALGFILSGSGVGGLILAPTIRALLAAVGGRWTLRTLALLNLVVALPVARSAVPSRFAATRRPTHVNVRLAGKPVFLVSTAAAFMQAAGNLLPLTFLPTFSTAALGYSASTAAWFLALSNGVNCAARIATGFLGDRYGRQNMLVCTVVLSFIAVVSFWLSCTSGSAHEGTLWICFIVVYGIAGGGYNALFPTTIVDLFGLQVYASVNGFMYFMRGLGAMVGSPVGGQLLGPAENDMSRWRHVVVFDATLLGLSAVAVISVRGLDAIDKQNWKWRA